MYKLYLIFIIPGKSLLESSSDLMICAASFVHSFFHISVTILLLNVDDT